ncbi:UDP-N-acetylglucosamine 2-epimerase (non-hydrolyzing) [Nostocoides sp. F2B08]|uniref:non-hydrolyzing UDP-N-acetylglucosamine 2-epimerase n=1 Tax=Nostocoides sp. F2B08 TaxID=2653936 RepID=UPI0012639F4A|nr:UDP-N-acetylglucosamine 2-epimerase (non-hydrolyzing) [Tetrasphaera sp. F2B08]KAB7743338.1 UDP-N-acetylglucosamine 2-epimerase (non-hydrolyzing) [Tetrasphaera sp. F2B08]
MKRVLVVAGTRPEVIKLAPVLRALRERPDEFDPIYCSTGQHREMLDQANAVFSLEPDIELGVMAPGQDLASLTSLLFREIDGAIDGTMPDAIVVQGDTTSAFVASMCGYYRRLVVGHVEAGLRTHDVLSPFPEETNRRIIGTTATHHFAPVERARQNLLREGVDPDRVFLTGNTVVDALQWITSEPGRADGLPSGLREALRDQRMVLLTSHRRESFGRGLADVCSAVLALVRDHPDVSVVYPVHLNPRVRGTVTEILHPHPRVHLIPPVSYPTLLALMQMSYVVVTDSGGIQEEAPSLGKPVLVLRDTTERPEAVEAGCARLVGTDPDALLKNADELLTSPAAYSSMIPRENPFGDGRAAGRIVDVLAVAEQRVRDEGAR